ncbi:hypothetical protein ROZALSC1DRAFT_24808 [Rozella allomycis CSF55]|uniref:Mon2/Sec7/BIG1-like HUS domain-containing protein n=1 Tax=Rozella allomycis (strain CSF55) TaxID=988480 RepID=A0A4P9YDA4_ROZAC|nr:hypothetical protein ROZALSC1DRAFT_24808 [Rozella allomycis CSF55]
MIRSILLDVIFSLKNSSKWSYSILEEDPQNPVIKNLTIASEEEDLYEGFVALVELIEDEDTNGPVLYSALTSLAKVLNMLGELSGDDINRVAVAVVNCHNDSSESSGELVVGKTCDVLRQILFHEKGDLLNDSIVCQIIETCFSVAFQMRSSGNNSLKEPRLGHSSVHEIHNLQAQLTPVVEGNVELKEEEIKEIKIDEKKEEMTFLKEPYGLNTLKELLRFLIDIINPVDYHNTDTMRCLGLQIIYGIIEEAKDHLIKFPGIFSQIKNELFNRLFLLFESENILLVTLSMKCLTCLFCNFLEDLKFHFEFFVELVIKKMPDKISFKNLQLEEIIFENLFTLLKRRNILEFYVNFDYKIGILNVGSLLVELILKVPI